MKALLTFLRALATDGVARLSGIGSVVLGVFGAMARTPLSGWTFWIAAFACFTYSAFRVWHKEHQTALAYKAQLDALSGEEHALELRRQRADLEKLERDNRRAAAEEKTSQFDDSILKLARAEFAAQRALGMYSANFTLTQEWRARVAKELDADVHLVNEALIRLRNSNRMPGLADVIFG